MKSLTLLSTALSFSALAATPKPVVRHVNANTFHVCRVAQNAKDEFLCQRIEGKEVLHGHAKGEIVNDWMAIPCGELKRLLPSVDCTKPFGQFRLGTKTDSPPQFSR